MKIALVTACLAGVAHSKMASLALKKEAQKRGYEICIEEQGGHKIPTRISNEEIEQSDVVIIAKMVSISGKDRFKGKKILEVSVNEAVRKPVLIIDKAEQLIKDWLMISLAINIKDEIGFHARTASLFAKKASKFESEIFIEFKGKSVNAKSTLSIMTLGVKSNDEIVLITNGNDEKEAHNALISYIENNFKD